MGRHHRRRPATIDELPALYRAPLVLDPLFLWTGAVALITFFAILNSDEPDPDIPVLLDSVLAMTVFSLFFGVFPAFIRLSLAQRRMLTAMVDPPQADPCPAALRARTTERGPFPLAAAVRRVATAKTPVDEYRSVMDAARAASVCLSVYLMGVARQEGTVIPLDDSAIRRLRVAMTATDAPFTSWLAVCQPLIDLVGSGSNEHLGAALGRLAREVDPVAGFSSASGLSIAALQQSLDEILRAAIEMLDTDRLLVHSVTGCTTSELQVTGCVAMGDRPEFQTMTVSMHRDTVAAPGGVVAVGPFGEWITLDPLLTFERCDDRAISSLYYFHQVHADDSVTYRAFQGDGVVTIAGRAGEVRRFAAEVFVN